MYLKDIKFKDVDDNITIGKAISCGKLRSILNKLPMHYLLNTSGITGNIIVHDDELQQVGYIDIAEDKYEKYE